MKREEAENALAKLEKVRRDLTQESALLRGAGTAPTVEMMSETLDHAVTELDDVARPLRDEVAAKAKNAKNYRMTYRHEGEDKPFRTAYGSPYAAVRDARQAFKAGAVVAEVRRVSDDVVIYDGPANITLKDTEW